MGGGGGVKKEGELEIGLDMRVHWVRGVKSYKTILEWKFQAKLKCYSTTERNLLHFTIV